MDDQTTLAHTDRTSKRDICRTSRLLVLGCTSQSRFGRPCTAEVTKASNFRHSLPVAAVALMPIRGRQEKLSVIIHHAANFLDDSSLKGPEQQVVESMMMIDEPRSMFSGSNLQHCGTAETHHSRWQRDDAQQSMSGTAINHSMSKIDGCGL